MDLKISEMMEYQAQLQAKNFEKWGGLKPEIARDQLLWAIIEAGDYALEDQGGGNVECGILHVLRECRFEIITSELIDSDLIRVRILQTAVVHLLDCREHSVLDDIENHTRVLVLESAPAHRLPVFGLGKDLGTGNTGNSLELFVLQFLLIQRTYEHQICQLLNHGQRIGYASGPNRCPDRIDLVLDLPSNHRIGIVCPY